VGGRGGAEGDSPCIKSLMHFARIRAVVRKEVRHMFRDPRTILMMIVQPIVFIGIFGYILSLDVKDIRTAWIDLDRSPESRALQRALQGSGYFRIVATSSDQHAGPRFLDEGRVLVAVVVPAGFGASLKSPERSAHLQILLDGSDNTVANTASGYLAGLLGQFNEDAIRDRLGRRGISFNRPQPRIETETRVWYNPDLSSTSFIVSGLIAVILMYQTSLLPAISIVRERENRTIDHLLLSPLRSSELVVAKVVPYAIMAVVNMNMIVATGMIFFDVPLRGSYFLLLALSLIFILVPVGLGIWVSTVTESQATAMLMAFILSNLPAFLLSGFIFPIESMPGWLQVATLAVPPRHYLVILRGILLKGLGFAELWPQALILLCMALGLLWVAARRFNAAHGSGA